MNQEELLDRFETHLRADKKSEATIMTYKYLAGRFLRRAGKPPAETTLEDLNEFKAGLASDYHATTINMHLSAAKALLESHGNFVCNQVKRVRVAREDPVPLTEGEMTRMLEVSKRDPLAHAVVATLYWTGMRVGSLAKLQWSDILWGEGKVVLRRAKRGKTFSVIIPEEALDAIPCTNSFGPSRSTPKTQRPFLSVRELEGHSTRQGRGTLSEGLLRRPGCTRESTHTSYDTPTGP